MKRKILNSSILLLCLALCFPACKKNKRDRSPIPAPPGDEIELITTFKLLFSDGTTTRSYLFKDPDGEGGIPAFYGPGTSTTSTQSDSVITLLSNHTYTVHIIILDESKTPVDSVSNEVQEKGMDHLFFFNGVAPSSPPGSSVAVSGSQLSITYLDRDQSASALPMGLLTEWRCGNTSPGVPLRIELRHQPGSKNGTYPPGDTDISVLFKVEIN